jgi:hypothetical protein
MSPETKPKIAIPIPETPIFKILHVYLSSQRQVFFNITNDASTLRDWDIHPDPNPQPCRWRSDGPDPSLISIHPASHRGPYRRAESQPLDMDTPQPWINIDRSGTIPYILDDSLIYRTTFQMGCSYSHENYPYRAEDMHLPSNHRAQEFHQIGIENFDDPKKEEKCKELQCGSNGNENVGYLGFSRHQCTMPHRIASNMLKKNLIPSLSSDP